MSFVITLIAYLRDLAVRFLRNHPKSAHEQIFFDALRTSAFAILGRRALS